MIRRPVFGVANLVQRFDSFVVDAAVVGVGSWTQRMSQVWRTMASGHTQHYALIMAAGVVALLAWAVLAI